MNSMLQETLRQMNRVLDHLYAYTGETGPGEPPEDGELCSE